MSLPPARFRTLAGFDTIESADPSLQPSQPVPPLTDDRFDLAGLLATIWGARNLIFLATMLGAALGYALTFVVDKTYEARATVFVTPATFSTELTPQPFSIEAFERLADSEYVRNQVTSELRKNGQLGPTEAPGRMTTYLYPSREPQKPFLPLIELQAQGRTPEIAQATANTWADIFVAEQAQLAAVNKSGSVDFVLQEFPKASQRLLETEKQLRAEETTLDQEYARVRTTGAVESKKMRLEALDELSVKLESDLVSSRVDLKQARERLARIEAELKVTSPVLNLVKGPSDEALWNAAARGAEGSTASGSLSKLSIKSEEPNPVHVSLSQQLADERVMVGSTEAREQSLSQQLAEVRRQASALRADLYQAEHQELALDRDHTMRLAPHQMALAEAKSRFTKLEEKIGDAQIAKAESDSDVKVGAKAERPVAPIGPDKRKYIGGAGLLALGGSIIALLLLTFLGLVPRTRVTQPAAAAH